LIQVVEVMVVEVMVVAQVDEVRLEVELEILEDEEVELSLMFRQQRR
jgi:hypothetical protein